MSKRIYVSGPIHAAGTQLLIDKGYVLEYGNNTIPLAAAVRDKGYDGIISFLTDTVDAAVFQAAPSVKIVSNYAVGFNNINTEDARTYHVVITNTPGCAQYAVAEHTVALLLALTTRTVEGDRYMRAGNYTGWNPELLIGTDLRTKTIGLYGLGSIGAEVARILSKGFGCRVLYTDITPQPSLETALGITYVSPEVLFANADVLSLHAPLTNTTRHLINADTIMRMKKGVYIINTARGGLIDEAALLKGLTDNHIAGAALDVFEEEPFCAPTLTTHDRVVLTPHIGSARESVRKEMSILVAQNLITFFETGKALHPVVVYS